MPVALRHLVLYSLLFGGLLLATLPLGLASDVGFWTNWAIYIKQHGLGNIYQRPDAYYNPVYYYLLWLYAKMAGSTANIIAYRHWLKALVLPFDFAGALLAASLVPEARRRFAFSLLLLLNVAFWYNTLIWQQIDAIYTFFGFLAVVAAVRQRLSLSLVALLLAFNTKPQALIFVPPLLLLWAPALRQHPLRGLRALALAALAQGVLLAPFIWGGSRNYLGRIIRNNLEITNLSPTVSQNAYNLWYLLLHRADITTVPDTLRFAAFSYHAWGAGLFLLFAGLLLLPLAWLVWQRIRRGAAPDTLLRPALLVCGSIPLLFTFFNTQMHERYWHAALLFFAAYGFLSRRFGLYALVSVAYFCNLEAVLRALHLVPSYPDVFRPRLIAGLFAVAIGWTFVEVVWVVRNSRATALTTG